MNPNDLPRSVPAAALDDVAHKDLDYSKVPYARPQPMGMIQDLVLPGVLQAVRDLAGGDPRLWVPISDTSSFRPVHFNVSQGFYAHVMRVTKGGVLSRHRHTGGVHALVLKGRWHYLEHDWVAEEGSYAFEPPGETHTLVVPDDCTEMITFFIVHGALMYVDPQGKATGYDDVFTRLEIASDHYEKVGLGRDFAKSMVR
ncbi:MAG: 2,4'-dihydroxyacetophenone dioxygenase family protein [Burkholderiales bacterium]|nr:2,4'-dihydroxyacetophenone dioxygenase family protein [Burkholderiales bacterium]